MLLGDLALRPRGKVSAQLLGRYIGLYRRYIHIMTLGSMHQQAPYTAHLRILVPTAVPGNGQYMDPLGHMR